MAKQYGIVLRLVLLGGDGRTVDAIEDHFRMIAATSGALGIKQGGMRIERISNEDTPEANEAQERKAKAFLTDGLPAEALESFEKTGHAEGELGAEGWDDGKSVLVNTRGTGGRGEMN